MFIGSACKRHIIEKDLVKRSESQGNNRNYFIIKGSINESTVGRLSYLFCQ